MGLFDAIIEVVALPIKVAEATIEAVVDVIDELTE